MTRPLKRKPQGKRVPPRLAQMTFPEMVRGGFLQEGYLMHLHSMQDNKLYGFIRGEGISLEAPEGPTEPFPIHEAARLALGVTTPRNGWELWRVACPEDHPGLFGCEIGLMPLREIRKAAVAEQWHRQTTVPEDDYLGLQWYVGGWIWYQDVDDWRNPPTMEWATRWKYPEVALTAAQDFVEYLHSK